MRVLVIEDDATTAKLVRLVLTEEGYAVDVATSGEDGRMLAHVNEYDAIILDLDLGDRNGLSILQELRRSGRTTPILIQTGHEADAEVVRGLDAGADDYVTKPVPNDVLRARVRALVRRGGAKRTEQVVIGNVVMNRLTRELRVGAHEVAFTPREFALLEHLMLHVDEVITRTVLLEKVWDMHFDPGSNVVDAHIARVRKKLTDHGATAGIRTVRGVGFVISRRKDEPTP